MSVAAVLLMDSLNSLTDIDESRIPSIVIPEETVIELVPTAYGCKECRYNIRERADSKERSLEDVE